MIHAQAVPELLLGNRHPREQFARQRRAPALLAAQQPVTLGLVHLSELPRGQVNVREQVPREDPEHLDPPRVRKSLALHLCAHLLPETRMADRVRAARELRRAGRSVKVLEARDRVGGRALNHTSADGTIVELVAICRRTENRGLIGRESTVLDMEGERIVGIDALIDPTLLPRFGFPTDDWSGRSP